jgi:hypothetical protein
MKQREVRLFDKLKAGELVALFRDEGLTVD